jgi:hypothetical protein
MVVHILDNKFISISSEIYTSHFMVNIIFHRCNDVDIAIR